MVGEEMTSSEVEELQEADPDMPAHLGNLGADLLGLGELQLELLSVDARDAVKQSYFPTVLACLGLGFFIGCCPLALLSLSWWLTDITRLTLAASSLIVAGVGLVLAVILLYFAWRGYRKSLNLLGRSRTEFRSNIRWLKHVLSQKHRRRWPL